MDPDNFIIKHWALHHPDLDECPKMRFKVIKTFNDPLSRLISESVWIDKMSNMNSKSEWRCNKMSRLVVETPAWLQKKPKMIEDKYESEKVVEREIEALKVRIGFTT